MPTRTSWLRAAGNYGAYVVDFFSLTGVTIDVPDMMDLIRMPSLFEQTRLRLARLSVGASTDLIRGLEIATETTAHTLGVERVGVWLWSIDGKHLVCVTSYDRSTGRHQGGITLDAALFPVYAHALQTQRVIVADDARRAVETRELTASYLIPNGIFSMLDAALHRSGEVVGVVCHEHTGSPRVWSDRERDLACSVADLVAVLFEQTTRLEIEAALVHQRERAARLEKDAALARLGAGLAHDFNSVLSSMLIRVETLRRAAKLRGDDVAPYDALMSEGQLGSRMVNQLLTYAKEGVASPIAIELNRTLETLRPTLERLLEGRCELELRTPDQRVCVEAAPTHIDQICLNLVLNARDAGAKKIHVELAQQVEDVVLVFGDDGIGMDDTTRRHAFEPFYTTKVSGGSGLGLAVVASIVEQCAGKIDLESSPNRGSRFVIRLPRSLAV